MGSLICLTNKRNKKQNGKTLNVANVASRPRSHPKTIYVVLCTILERRKQLRCLIISSLQKIKEKEIWTLQTTKQNNKITNCKHYTIPFAICHANVSRPAGVSFPSSCNSSASVTTLLRCSPLSLGSPWRIMVDVFT